MTGFGLYMIVLQMSETASLLRRLCSLAAQALQSCCVSGAVLLRKRCSIAAQAVQCGCMEAQHWLPKSCRVVLLPRCPCVCTERLLRWGGFGLCLFKFGAFLFATLPGMAQLCSANRLAVPMWQLFSEQ